MKTGLNVLFAFAVIVGLVSIYGIIIAGWDRPPPETKQIGYRGVGMQELNNLRTYAATIANQKLPDLQDPAEPGGPPAEPWKNVQVLGDLTENQFNRLMLSITTWVAPEQGCEYCHNVENMAEDSKYTKIVARRMLQMNKKINAGYSAHVGQTGVTCYTCHRGNNVPQHIWFEQPSETRTSGLLGTRAGQNAPSAAAAYASLPNATFSALLVEKGQIRQQSERALPVRAEVRAPSVKETEKTYGLMMHMSTSLGVNCTYCHNSRAFGIWEQSTPQRVTAWHGIQMVRDLNENYLVPLKSTYPANRLGPLGDAPKAYCTTCHQGLAKPLNGAQMWKDNPELDVVKLP
jgi:photosynthetic reaction center cytochrome c subunit